MLSYRAPPWLPGGHLQTIWPALLSRRFAGDRPAYTRERWETPDGDFIDVDTQAGAPGSPMLVLFHGLEGSSRSHYAEAFAHEARRAGWTFVVPHFRGCSGELNRAPRAYHSGDHEEIGWILARLRQRHGVPLHGFRDTDDYWRRASAKPHLARIRIPALVLNARNDPFVPASSLPRVQQVGPCVTLWQPAHGGHVGFAHGPPPGHVMTLPEAVLRWMRTGG